MTNDSTKMDYDKTVPYMKDADGDKPMPISTNWKVIGNATIEEKEVLIWKNSDSGYYIATDNKDNIFAISRDFETMSKRIKNFKQ